MKTDTTKISLLYYSALIPVFFPSIVFAQTLPPALSPALPVQKIETSTIMPDDVSSSPLSCAKLINYAMQCAAFSCSEKDSLTGNLVYKSIVGKENQQCHYREISGQTVRDCTIPNDKFSDFLEYYQNTTVALTGNAKIFVDKNCKESSFHSEALPQKNDNVPFALWTGSAMFNIDTLRLFEDTKKMGELARKGVGLVQDIKDTYNPYGAPTIQQKDLKPLPREKIPYFILSAILYECPENWEIWLNNKKISRGKDQKIVQSGDVIVESINDKHVTFKLQTSILDFLAPEWKSKLKSTDATNYTSEDKRISVQSKDGIILFTLEIDQGFMLYDMKIVEEYAVNKGAALKTDGLPEFTLPTLKDVVAEAEKEAEIARKKKLDHVVGSITGK